MNNCLVTKLKETVNNDNLDIYGVMKLRVASNVENKYFHFWVEDDTEITMTLESDDENEYFSDINKNKIGKTITAEKNTTSNGPSNAFYVVAAAGRVVTIKDEYKSRRTFSPFYQYRESLEQDLKWRDLSVVDINRTELVCNVKKLIKANNNAPFKIALYGSENVVYDDIRVFAYCFPTSVTSIDYGFALHPNNVKTIGGKRDILQIIAVRRYLGNTEGDMHFVYPHNAYIGDVPLNTYGSFSQIKFAWTEDTIKVYTAGDDGVYSEVATISNSDKYDWE